jgi:hypothetical protein
VAGLVECLGRADPEALIRIRRVAGARRARIVLDDEAIEVAFGPSELLIEPATEGPVDGEGITDRSTVLGVLDGYLEVTDAVLDGRLRVLGPPENVTRMFQVIEILVDGAVRIPELQSLAADFRRDPCRESPGLSPAPRPRQTAWFPTERSDAEQGLLARLGLLSDNRPTRPA